MKILCQIFTLLNYLKISQKRLKVEKVFYRNCLRQWKKESWNWEGTAQWIVLGREIVSRVACGMQSDLWQLPAILFICQINH